MTDATTACTELTETGADIDMLSPVVQFMVQRMVELDVEGRCGAACDDKNPA